MTKPNRDWALAIVASHERQRQAFKSANMKKGNNNNNNNNNNIYKIIIRVTGK